MVIAANGDYAGLLSGGCLEGDLREHALAVIATGTCCPVRYDLRGPDDQLWGLGMGCEGYAMQILLLRVGPDNDWQPMAEFTRSLTTRTATAIGVVVESRNPEVPLGSLVLPDRTTGAPQLATAAITAIARARRQATGRSECVARSFSRVETVRPAARAAAARHSAVGRRPRCDAGGRVCRDAQLEDHAG